MKRLQTTIINRNRLIINQLCFHGNNTIKFPSVNGRSFHAVKYNRTINHENFNTNNNINNTNKIGEDTKQSTGDGDGNSKGKYSSSRIIILGMGGVLVLVSALNYFYHYMDLSKKIIEKASLTDGESCIIYGKLDSDMVLKLEGEEYYENDREPVFINENVMQGSRFSKTSTEWNRLKCYPKDLKVRFAFGKSFKDWVDPSNELTESLELDLKFSHILKEPKEFYLPIDSYNSHLRRFCKENENENIYIDRTLMIKMFKILDRKVIQHVLNKNDNVILVGKVVDRERKVFKCSTIISPNEEYLHYKLGGEMAIGVGVATLLGVLAMFV